MLLMIDNYDSFTYNVVQYLAELGANVQVYRNDELTVDQLLALNPERVVISPGPCTPNEAGVSMALIERCAGQIPLLGSCLGHQSLGQVFGGQVVRAAKVMHGKTSAIHHNGTGVFRDLPSPFVATRYHSLVVDQTTLPEDLEGTAWTVDEHGRRDEIMGLRHRPSGAEGVQFHPESVLSEHGHALLKNFLEQPAGRESQESEQ